MVIKFLFSAILMWHAHFLNSQSIEYSLIEDDFFWWGEVGSVGTSTAIKKTSLYKPDSPLKVKYIPVLINAHFPFCWTKAGDKIILVSGYGQIPVNGNMIIETFETPTEDSLTLITNRKKRIDELEQEFGNRDKAIMRLGVQEGLLRNKRRFSPAIEWLSGIYMNNDRIKDIAFFSYDLIQVAKNEFEFYIRNRKELSIWKYYYPETAMASDYSDWAEMITFSSDNTVYTPTPLSKIDDSVLPKRDKYVFNSIPDDLFFQGHFKVVKQKENVFLINLQHGAIYFISKTGILKVGQIDLGNYKELKPGKKTFVEDKKKNVIYFFTNVIKQNDLDKFPNVEIIRNVKDFRKKFPGLEWF